MLLSEKVSGNSLMVDYLPLADQLKKIILLFNRISLIHIYRAPKTFADALYDLSKAGLLVPERQSDFRRVTG